MLVLLTILNISFYSIHCKVEVKISQGKLYGTTEATIFNGRRFYAFYGVPYAKAPVGKLRFKNPVPLKKWNKPYYATTEYRGACAQSHIVHKHGMYGVEDCLRLNIFTPYLPNFGIRNSKAVIVWIHGYAYTSGFSHLHGGDFLIDNDVILVTLNHRISSFGFLKINKADNDTNMGLKDIVIGLKWVKKNIHYFGGDKMKVTLAGSGSAATYISLLMMTKFRKLFSQVILQSGSLFSPSMFQGDPIDEKKYLVKILKQSGFENIQNAPAKEIVMHSAKIYESKHTIDVQRAMIPFLPINGTNFKGSMLSKGVLDFDKNIKHLKFMPIMIGFTTQESITEVLPFIHHPEHLKSLEPFKYVVPFSNHCIYKPGTKTYKEIGDKIRKKYFKQNNNKPSLDGLLKYVSDLHKYPIYKFIQRYLNLTETQLYVYKFNYVGNFSAAKATSVANTDVKIKGAAHGDEICYIFKCEPLWENYVTVKKDLHNQDRHFITQIAEKWANFAKNGEPTRDYSWLPMTRGSDRMLLLNKQSKLVDSKPERKMFDFWNSVYEKYYSPESCNRQVNIKDEL